ncbi:MAG: alpha-galactosidase [Actinobacteria bacterium]|nr:alpha-galactosidase [Actinomycetota bacterium]
MQLQPARVVAVCDGQTHARPVTSSGSVAVGPLDVSVSLSERRLELSIGNAESTAARVRSVALVMTLVDTVEPVRMFRNGYQSWSPTGVATFGADRDPSTTPGAIEFLQAVHHADQLRAAEGELRSEWVTVLADAAPNEMVPNEMVLVGFDGGSEHDGTLRLRRGRDGSIELWVEAFLGDAVLGEGEQRTLHGATIEYGDHAPGLLQSWARAAGRAGRARVSAPYQVGWCSWYHYFHGITEEALHSNLHRAASAGWPFDVFQLDDGFQAAIGDWLDTNDKFPSSLDMIAGSIAKEGFRPGLWLAPFLLAPDSRTCIDHPDWVARHRNGKPLHTWFNPAWDGGAGGMMYCLDTTQPAVVEHLRSLAAALVEAGFTYLKLDFTFAPSCDGVWADASFTPAQRVRAGYQAVRDGAGADAFLLGCGVPLANVVGLVDGNRIGQDVAPVWALDPAREIIPGYLGVEPATQHAYANTVARSFMHRNLWLNDPDCLMLRAEKTELSSDAIRTWASAVGMSGGMALVSDDLALLGDEARALLDETVALGRVADGEAVAGRPAVAEDLMDTPVPTRFSAAGRTLVTDPVRATSTLD